MDIIKNIAAVWMALWFAAVAFSALSTKPLLGLHLVFTLGVLVLVGLNHLGKRKAEGTMAPDETIRDCAVDFKSQFASLCERLAEIRHADAERMLETFRQVNEADIQCADSKSLPGGEEVESIVNVYLMRIERKVASLAEAAEIPSPKEGDIGSKASMAEFEVKKIIAGLDKDLRKMRRKLKQRELLQAPRH